VCLGTHPEGKVREGVTMFHYGGKIRKMG